MQGIEDVEGVRKRIAEIRGVKETDYSYLTQKLQVKYEGDAARLREIDLEIKKVLRGKTRNGQ